MKAFFYADCLLHTGSAACGYAIARHWLAMANVHTARKPSGDIVRGEHGPKLLGKQNFALLVLSNRAVVAANRQVNVTAQIASVGSACASAASVAYHDNTKARCSWFFAEYASSWCVPLCTTAHRPVSETLGGYGARTRKGVYKTSCNKRTARLIAPWVILSSCATSDKCCKRGAASKHR